MKDGFSLDISLEQNLNQRLVFKITSFSSLETTLINESEKFLNSHKEKIFHYFSLSSKVHFNHHSTLLDFEVDFERLQKSI